MPPLAERVSTLLVTGPLGAGKTRFIAGLLGGGHVRDAAVLVNEFAETGIDQDIFAAHGIAAQALAGGCICCTVRGEMRRSIEALLFARARGEVPPFQRLIIETSGLADPAPVLTELLEDVVLRRRLRVCGVVAVADAAAPLASTHESETATRQIAMADAIVVSKLDLAPDARDALAAMLRSLNPSAAIWAGAEAETATAGLMADRVQAIPQRPLDRTSQHARSVATSIRSLYLEPSADTPPQRLFAFVENLASTAGSTLLRLKGMIRMEPQPGAHRVAIVHGVRGRLYPPEFADCPDRPSSRLVAILDGIDEATVLALAACNGVRCT